MENRMMDESEKYGSKRISFKGFMKKDRIIQKDKFDFSLKS